MIRPREKTKKLKIRLKALKEKQYTQDQADAAGGLKNDATPIYYLSIYIRNLLYDTVHVMPFVVYDDVCMLGC